jgi:protein CpxP
MTDSNPGGRSRTASFVLVALVAAVFGAAAGHFVPVAMGHGGGWHHRGHWDGHGMSAADIDARLDRMVDRFSRHADATPEQRAKIAEIAKAAATDLQPLHQQLRETHKRALALLRQPTIDRGAVEALRAEQIARADGASKRLAQALADVADVLTPEQRVKMADHFERFGRGRGRGRDRD